MYDPVTGGPRRCECGCGRYATLLVVSADLAFAPKCARKWDAACDAAGEGGWVEDLGVPA